MKSHIRVHLSGVPTSALGPGPRAVLPPGRAEGAASLWGKCLHLSHREVRQKPWEHISRVKHLGFNPAVVQARALLPRLPWVAREPASGEAKRRPGVAGHGETGSGRLGEATTGPHREARPAGEGRSLKEKQCRILSVFLFLDKVLSPGSWPGLGEAKMLPQPRPRAPFGRIIEHPGPSKIRAGAHCLWATPGSGGQEEPSAPWERPGQPARPWGGDGGGTDLGVKPRPHGQHCPAGSLEQVTPAQLPDGPLWMLWDHEREAPTGFMWGWDLQAPTSYLLSGDHCRPGRNALTCRQGN